MAGEPAGRERSRSLYAAASEDLGTPSVVLHCVGIKERRKERRK
jgi:hypothetical protein